MSDTNDMFVSSNCQTKIHINGYVFTVAELFNIARNSLTSEELEKHRGA